jgi:hypothetical protein
MLLPATSIHSYLFAWAGQIDLCWLLASSVRFFWSFRQKFRLAIKAADLIRADERSSQHSHVPLSVHVFLFYA